MAGYIPVDIGRDERSTPNPSALVNLHTLHSEIWLPQPLRELFPFFADAYNLESLTPPWVKFNVLTPAPIEMYKGVLIDYRLKIHGFPVRWQSEITAWDPPHRFVDEQRRGPYRVWIHEHRFEEREGGTQMIDHVRYAVPGGALINALFVRRDVKRIWAYRSARLAELFGERRIEVPLLALAGRRT